ncbi:hypothetical protein HID58_005335 [Brassica napus]|uniref:Uncharacterized protein n=1 Tax=Brassica napus TaxID=3708 RepID=A0ABQ8E891_BRANA|nr:hypothetical protein HID58_005335 [Brassica napus]
MVNQTSVTIAQAPSPLFFTQVSAGPGDSKLQFRLIHFWEARKHAKGGILIGIEMLMINEQLKRGSIYTLTNFFASNSKVMYGVADQKLVICITHTSILSKLEENIEGIPSQCFRIHSFPDFEANCDLRGDLYAKMLLVTLSWLDGQALHQRPVLRTKDGSTSQKIMVHLQLKELSLTVTKIVSPAVLPPKDRPLEMPPMPISSSQNNHTASEVDSSVVTKSSGGGLSYANSHPSSATDEEKKPKRIRRNG